MDDEAAGIVQSSGGRPATLARRVGVQERVCMSGGVARCQAVRDAVAASLGTEILFSPFAQCFGALGAALYARRRGGTTAAAPAPEDARATPLSTHPTPAPEDEWRHRQLSGLTELPEPHRRRHPTTETR
jgi:sugar (pentulose or hexulose) kinase